MSGLMDIDMKKLLNAQFEQQHMAELRNISGASISPNEMMGSLMNIPMNGMDPYYNVKGQYIGPAYANFMGINRGQF